MRCGNPDLGVAKMILTINVTVNYYSNENNAVAPTPECCRNDNDNDTDDDNDTDNHHSNENNAVAAQTRG